MLQTYPVDGPDIPLSIIFDILKAPAFQKYSTDCHILPLTGLNAFVYDKVSRKLTNGGTNAKKLITRPIMTVTSPNSPHIALTYTKLRFDHFFDHTYPPSWS